MKAAAGKAECRQRENCKCGLEFCIEICMMAAGWAGGGMRQARGLGEPTSVADLAAVASFVRQVRHVLD